MRILGFISSRDPEAAQIAILPGNGTIPPGDEYRYESIAAGNAAGIAAARQLVPGVPNVALAAGAGLLLLLIVAKGSRG
jgi:hypothetical protein